MKQLQALISHTEQEVHKSINTMLDIENVTIIAIAYRLSTIKHMDRIIVMDKGKIVEDGTFKGLWEHQVNGFV
ncbi:multidrug ABC transporter permease [Candidatus Rickettsia tasmanensis]